jgi:hypothetical protein
MREAPQGPARKASMSIDARASKISGPRRTETLLAAPQPCLISWHAKGASSAARCHAGTWGGPAAWNRSGHGPVWPPSGLSFEVRRAGGQPPDQPIILVVRHPQAPFTRLIKAMPTGKHDQAELEGVMHEYLRLAGQLPPSWIRALDPRGDRSWKSIGCPWAGAQCDGERGHGVLARGGRRQGGAQPDHCFERRDADQAAARMGGARLRIRSEGGPASGAGRGGEAAGCDATASPPAYPSALTTPKGEPASSLFQAMTTSWLTCATPWPPSCDSKDPLYPSVVSGQGRRRPGSADTWHPGAVAGRPAPAAA